MTSAAFEQLFERHFEPLTRDVTRIVRSPHVAAELVQDVFLRLWSGRAELAIQGDVRGYLRRAARNRALDCLRREYLHRAWERAAAHEARSWTHDAHGAQAAQAAQQERFALLHDVLASTLAAMPARRRAVCELRWRDGIGPSAIAQRLGVSIKTVETHLALGLREIRSRLP